MSTLSKEQMIAQVAETLNDLKDHSSPAYTVITGAGFSAPVFPTSEEMVADDIPWWLFCQKEDGVDFFGSDRPEAFSDFRRRLWKRVAKENPAITITLDSATELPKLTSENVAVAYRAIMNGQTTQGLFTPARRKSYFKDVMQKADGRLNRAHLYLAALLDSQKNWREMAPFCDTVFSSAFDPMLPQGLGLAKLLYSMSNLEERGIDLIGEDYDDAIKLIYTEGAMYQAIYPDSIPKALDERATAKLNSYLQGKGVIVIGCGGNDNVLIDTLLQCGQFESQLYWCDIQPSEDRLGSSARELLENSNHCFYVQTDAGELMQDLYCTLNGQLIPSFIANPIEPLIAQLSGLVQDSEETLENEALKKTLVQLNAFNENYDVPLVGISQLTALMNDAKEAVLDEEWELALELWEQVLEQEDVTPEQQAQAGLSRAEIHYQSGYAELAIDDYSAVIAIMGVPAEHKANALMMRAEMYKDANQMVAVISDYNAVIRMKSIPITQKIDALMARGSVYSETGEIKRALSDYNAIIKSERVLPQYKVKAYLGRAGIYEEKGDTEQEIENYTAVIELDEVPAGDLAKAYLNRGAAYGQQGEPSLTISDCSVVIGMDDISREETVNAYLNRGIAYAQKGLYIRAIDDYTSMIEIDGLSDEELAEVYLNRSFAYGREGMQKKEVEDCAAVIKLKDALPDQKAKARLQRSVAHGQAGDAIKAMADYSAVIKMDDVSSAKKALAYAGRGWMLYENEEFEQAADDYKQAWKLPPVPSSIGINFAIILLCIGESEKAVKVCSRAISNCDNIEILLNAQAEISAANKLHGPFDLLLSIEKLLDDAQKKLQTK